ncbi:MAG: cytochrome-c peroxidase [Blastocatellia bacterium]|nr:cytochrome-c peroxidase [Blastocatellia bacterium]
MNRTATLKCAIIIILALLFSTFAQADGRAGGVSEFNLDVPLGISPELWSYYVPKDNPLTAAKVELGRMLFFDKLLSSDSSVSCASCHEPRFAFADGKRVAEGIGGKRGTRNSPTILNAMFNTGQFWDGRADSLEAQAKMPLVDPNEMGNESFEQVVERLEAIPDYASRFREVFGGRVRIDSIAKAIAAFERTLVSANSPFDRFIAGDREALSEAAERGFFIFRTKGRCTICHSLNQAFPFLTDQNFRNTGVAANHPAFGGLTRRAMQIVRTPQSRASLGALATEDGAHELGRFLVTGNALDLGTFRTPSLRNVELTAPYFHDGSAATLADVVRFYMKGGNDNPSRDWELQPVDLTEREQSDLIEFLKSLTGDDARRMYGDQPSAVSRQLSARRPAPGS